MAERSELVYAHGFLCVFSLFFILQMCTSVICAILQWALYASENVTGVECSTILPLATACISTLSVLVMGVYTKLCTEMSTHMTPDINRCHVKIREDLKEVQNNCCCTTVLFCSLMPHLLLKTIEIVLVICSVLNRSWYKCGSHQFGQPDVLITLFVLEFVSITLDLCTERLLNLSLRRFMQFRTERERRIAEESQRVKSLNIHDRTRLLNTQYYSYN